MPFPGSPDRRQFPRRSGLRRSSRGSRGGGSSRSGLGRHALGDHAGTAALATGAAAFGRSTAGVTTAGSRLAARTAVGSTGITARTAIGSGSGSLGTVATAVLPAGEQATVALLLPVTGEQTAMAPLGTVAAVAGDGTGVTAHEGDGDEGEEHRESTTEETLHHKPPLGDRTRVRPKKPSRSEPRSGTATGPQRTSCSKSKNEWFRRRARRGTRHSAWQAKKILPVGESLLPGKSRR